MAATGAERVALVSCDVASLVRDLELLAAAVVFVTNIRPAALDRLGLDFQTVAARNRALVYGILTGYGLDGPAANRPAYDVAAFWARAGIADLLTRPGDTPPFQRGGMGDHSAGTTLAAAICAALVSRNRTGVGQLVTTSLYRQGAYTVSIATAGPTITAAPITGVAGKAVSGTIAISAPGATSISVSITGVPLGMGFSISGLTLTASWPGPVAGSYAMKVTVVDSAGLSASTTVPITISAK